MWYLGVPGVVIFNSSLQNASQSSDCHTVRVIFGLSGGGRDRVLGYQLIYSHSEGSVREKTVLGQNVSIDNLDGGRTYRILARAKNVYGYGFLSDPLTIETPKCTRKWFCC